MASAWCDRPTCRKVLAGLVNDKLIEIGSGEHLARTLSAMAGYDVLERPCCHVTIEGLDRTAELCGSLRWGQQSAWHRHVGAVLLAWPWPKMEWGKRKLLGRDRPQGGFRVKVVAKTVVVLVPPLLGPADPFPGG